MAQPNALYADDWADKAFRQYCRWRHELKKRIHEFYDKKIKSKRGRKPR